MQAPGMSRPTPGATVRLREAARLLGLARRQVLELVEQERLELHAVVRGHALFLRADVVALRRRAAAPASGPGAIACFLLPGESWAAWESVAAATRRVHAAEDRRYARQVHRRERPATGDGPRIVFLRTSGVHCAGCDAGLSSGRDQVRVESDGERWWLCAACGDASGAIVPEPMLRRRVG